MPMFEIQKCILEAKQGYCKMYLVRVSKYISYKITNSYSLARVT